MKINSKVIVKAGGLLIATAVRHWMGTLDFKVAAKNEAEFDPAHPDFQGPVIFLLWHEYIPFLFSLRGHCDVAMLVSRHRDAEWLSEATRHMGFSTVRGSTNRGGVAAMRSIFAECRSLNLAITPDGPKGPRRRLAPGAVFLSSKLQIPLIPLGLGYDRPWRCRTWDQLALPKFYSRARAIPGPRIQIPPNLDRDEMERYRLQVESTVNYLTDRAEQWAESGKRMEHERPLIRKATPLAKRRSNRTAAPDAEPIETLRLRALGLISVGCR